MVDSQIKRPKFNQLKYQYLAVISANLLTFCQGCTAGWLSPSLKILQSENSPLVGGPITLFETALLGLLPSIGALAGTILFSIFSSYLGPITSISLLALPNLTFWIILISSNSIELILIGSLIAGLSLGGLCVGIPLFVADISHSSIRGCLGLICQLSFSCGVLGAYICGALLDFHTVPYVIIALPVLFLVAMSILPETPYSLLQQNKIESARESLTFYSNGNDKTGFDVDGELRNLQILLNQREENRRQSSWKLILNKQSLKDLSTVLCMVAVVVLSGTNAIMAYASNVFADSQANLNADISAMILGFLQVLGMLVSSLMIDSWGRKKLFGMSCGLSGMALLVFGTLSYFNYQGSKMASMGWSLVACMSFYIFVNSSGMRPLPFVYVAESLPDNIRHLGTTACMLALFLFNMISIGTFPIFIEMFKLHSVMWMNGAICLLGVIFAVFVMEETKGKNLNAANQNVADMDTNTKTTKSIKKECFSECLVNRNKN